ncbi:hypothetical protein B1207_06500 [Legionella quinlivanii]|uniref:Uncharacterized protein n=1 Tax=Legionella quinlivanii TaxID=45073 RepID=A0A364LKC7_9GAMM|nr:ankyrin repeat domain-containing protein [Legionella quinlivanii]RAP37067.1 hypothetical protein B1207_06500 [Legionella quinlivanii]
MISHYKLIKIGRALGYTTLHESGLCRGFTAMWAQAVCCNDLPRFYKRLVYLNDISDNPEQLVCLIDELRKKSRDIGFTNLSEIEQLFLEMPAFFEGISLYQDPRAFKSIFEKYLYQLEWGEITPFLLPERLSENQDSFIRALNTLEQFNNDTLESYLYLLSEVLEGRRDVAIIIDTENHSRGIRVVGKDKFEWADVNHIEFAEFPLNSQELSRLLSANKKEFILHIDIITTNNKSLTQETIEAIRPKAKLSHLLDSIYGKGFIAFWAIYNGDLETIKRIDFEKNDVNHTNRSHTPLLQAAIDKNQREIIKYLLTIPSLDVNKRVYGRSAFCEMLGDWAVTELIIEHPGFNPNHYVTHKNTPLHHLAFYSYAPESIAIAEHILKKGGNPNLKNHEGDTPLMVACRNNNQPMAELLLRYGAKPNIQSNTKSTALHYAVENKNKGITELLLRAGANCDLKDNEGQTPLIIANFTRDKTLIPLLIQQSTWSSSDIRWGKGAVLLPAISNAPLEFQKDLILKAVRTYIQDRLKEPDYPKLFSKFSRKEKVEAASALFARMNGNRSIRLEQYLDVLCDGRLSTLMDLCINYQRRITATSHLTKNRPNNAAAQVTENYRQRLGQIQSQKPPDPPSHIDAKVGMGHLHPRGR